MDTTPTTDIVVLDEENTLNDSDDSGTSNLPLMGVALVAGAVIGQFVVPPVVGFVKNLFSKTDTTVEVEDAQITEITETQVA